MGRLRSRSVGVAFIVLSLWSIAGCGGGSKAGPPLFAGRIIMSPAANASLTLGGTLTFSATVQTVSGTTLATAVTFTSTDTSILNLAPNGVACAGHWDVAFTTCTPGNVGPVQVTASALGATSIPTWVFVHPPIDNITVNGVLINGVTVQEPCLSQSQSMTIEAHAYSQGTDVTASVGPFTWTANNSTVVSLTPLVNSAYNFATNQATAKAVNPGITYIYAAASGVTSSSFQQPQLTNAQGTASPVLDFFATCAIQNIALEMTAAGSGRTTFTSNKGSTNSQTVIATVMDIFKNTSLPNTQGGIVLSKIPLTWSSSQPQVVTAASSCTLSCALTVPLPGSATVTASCSPPICNVGFPVIPNAFLTNGVIDNSKIASCTSFFQALYPQFFGCQALIPTPVYASPVFITPPNTQSELSPMAAISGVVSGTPSPINILAGSTGCSGMTPADCTSAVYYLSTAKATAGSSNPLPTPPNSFLFTPAGDRILMGSNYGSQIIIPANFGTTNNPFTSLGTVTGKVLAISASGQFAAFSDTIHTPNQTYIVNTGNPAAPTALNISSASLAAFSPDTLKTFIVGGNNASSLYIYSPAQALQGPFALQGPAKGIAFSPNAAFAFVAEATGSGGANLTAFANCNNQTVASIPLPADPIFMKVLPPLHIDGRDSFGNTIPDGIHVLILDSTGVDIVTSTVSVPASGNLCPQGLAFVSGDPLRSVQRIELGEGTLQPINFFASADSTQLYVVSSSSSSILVYNMVAGAVVGGIELQNSATPLSADISSDSGTISISGSDGMLHEVSTLIGGSDSIPLSFPSLPNAVNPFCTIAPGGTPCVLNVALPKP
jgi:hypothetical protein